jgi:aryl-alcohol dehydrogenase-like predicted oxidoreductase
MLARGDDVIAIPGTRVRTHLEENAAAATLHLDRETLRDLDRAVPADAVVGDRRSPADTGIEE